MTGSPLPAPLPHDSGVLFFHCRFWNGWKLAYEFECYYFPDNESGARFVPRLRLTRKVRDELRKLKMTIHNPRDVKDLDGFRRRYWRDENMPGIRRGLG